MYNNLSCKCSKYPEGFIRTLSMDVEILTHCFFDVHFTQGFSKRQERYNQGLQPSAACNVWHLVLVAAAIYLVLSVFGQNTQIFIGGDYHI